MIITDRNKINTYYRALLNRDQSYVGIFYVGVKTTSIFCIATCRARKPKLKNVEFYTTFQDAIDNGYRPCKICKPTQNADQTPPQVQKAMELIKLNPQEKISDLRLKENNISADLVRRWFKKNYGLTFHAYQRMHRINNAFTELKHGKKTTDTAFNTGYESLSGFGYTFKKLMGISPRKSKEKSIILINRLTSPLGPMFICATEDGICLLNFVDQNGLEASLKKLGSQLNAQILIGENEHIQQAKKELAEYFHGVRKKFEVKIHLMGTDFQKLVWTALLQIPYGTTSSYQNQSISINHPKSIRAMASANGKNLISIIVPCHRVIGSNGDLRGYSGGLERKRWLIEHEQNFKDKRCHGVYP